MCCGRGHPTSGFGGRKDENPCEHYAGNLCTGFGNEDQTCWSCGWERIEHDSEYTAFKTKVLGVDVDYDVSEEI